LPPINPVPHLAPPPPNSCQKKKQFIARENQFYIQTVILLMINIPASQPILVAKVLLVLNTPGNQNSPVYSPEGSS
jgi:hypothetical protein